MSFASQHGVQIAVFGDPLLAYGGLFSSKTVEADIAATVATVLDRVFRGEFAGLPPVTPLSEIEVRINPAALQRLGLEPSANAMADAQ